MTLSELVRGKGNGKKRLSYKLEFWSFFFIKFFTARSSRMPARVKLKIDSLFFIFSLISIKSKKGVMMTSMRTKIKSNYLWLCTQASVPLPFVFWFLGFVLMKEEKGEGRRGNEMHG